MEKINEVFYYTAFDGKMFMFSLTRCFIGFGVTKKVVVVNRI